MTLLKTEKGNTSSSILELSQPHLLHVKLDLEDPIIKKQVEAIDLTLQDLAIIRTIAPIVIENTSTLVSFFYDRLAKNDHQVKITSDHSRLEKHIDIFKKHLINILECQIDNQYIEKWTKIAEVHVKVGLSVPWFIAGNQVITNGLFELVSQHVTDLKDAMVIVSAVSKILNLEMQLILGAYERVTRNL